MAASITIADIKDLQATSLPDSVLNQYIAFVDQADTCLDNNNVASDVQKLIKTYGAAHLVSAADRGDVESERSPTGASRSYRKSDSANPLMSTKWGEQLVLFDQYGCVVNLLQSSQSLLIAAPGPGGNNGGTYKESGPGRA